MIGGDVTSERQYFRTNVLLDLSPPILTSTLHPRIFQINHGTEYGVWYT